MENSENNEIIYFGLPRKDLLFTILIFFFFGICFWITFFLNFGSLSDSITDKGKTFLRIFQIGTLLAVTLASLYVYYSKKVTSFFYLALFWFAHSIYKVFTINYIPVRFSPDGSIKEHILYSEEGSPTIISGENVGKRYLLIAIVALVADLPLLLSSFPQKKRKLWVFSIPIITFALMVIIYNSESFNIIQKIKILYFISPFHSFVIFVWLTYSIRIKNVFEVSKKVSIYFAVIFIAFAISQIPFIYESYCTPKCLMNEMFDNIQRIFGLLIFVGALFVTLSEAKEILSGIREKKRHVESNLQRTKTLLAREKELNAEISKQKEELEEKKEEFKSLFLVASSVEHELRNPLSVINSTFITMRRKYPPDDKVIKYLDDLDIERNNMIAAVDLVNTLRSDPEDIEFGTKEVHLKDFFNSIKRKVETEFKGRLTDVYIQIEEKKERLFVNGIPFLFEKIFINLIKNSIESILLKDDKKGVIKIILNVDEKDKDKVLITIKDNGNGFINKNREKMSEEEIKKCISASYTTKSANDSKPNRGIGLFVSDRVIKLHKGNLKMKNAEDGGAEIIVTLDRIIK